MGDVAANVTRLLHQWKAGDRGALDRLIPIVYPQVTTVRQAQTLVGKLILETTAPV